MATKANNIVLKGNYNSAVVMNKSLAANGETVSLSGVTSVVREGSTASNAALSLGEGTVATGAHSIATGKGCKAAANYSVAEGVSAEVQTGHDYSYVFNGNPNAAGKSMGTGTFNIYTRDSSKNVFIDGLPLSGFVNEYVSQSVAVLSSYSGKPNRFTTGNVCTAGLTSDGFVLGSGTTADLANAKEVLVPTKKTGTADGTAASTKFVSDSVANLSSSVYGTIKAVTGEVYTKAEVESLIEDYLKKALGDDILVSRGHVG